MRRPSPKGNPALVSHGSTAPTKADLDEQLNDALKDSFPASDPVTIGEASAAEPDRPLHRRPAALDTDLVNELARNVEATHAAQAAMEPGRADLQGPSTAEDSNEQGAPSPIGRKREHGTAEQRALSRAVSNLDSRN